MVPVAILTGFLGSGKTTLLNRLFRARPPGRGRLAIIVNEFGDVGIDADLLPEGAARRVELPGGCICCALVEDLKTALVDVLDAAPDLEQIIIETTGIADPLPISWTLADAPLADRVRLAAVITVVDPLEHERSRGESPSADAQVRYADILVVSKLDQVGGTVPAELEASLRARNPVAPIVARPADEAAGGLWAVLGDPALPDANLLQVNRNVGNHGAAPDGHGIESAGFAVAGTYDLEQLVAGLEELPPNILRLKGIVRAIDRESGRAEPALYAVHRVGARVSTEPFAGSPSACTRVVALGRGMETAALRDCFEAAMVISAD
jgi:G3E family GTPase